jgi:hypothetical protein
MILSENTNETVFGNHGREWSYFRELDLTCSRSCLKRSNHCIGLRLLQYNLKRLAAKDIHFPIVTSDLV